MEEEIEKLAKKLNETDDLFLLADLYLLIGVLLKNNGFPTGKYKKWKEKQK